jgi:hypothetical protein
MRIRQIKPSWWLDKDLRRLTAAEREFYIGLWMLADDAGWLELDVERIAAELYPYDGTRRRERFVATSLERIANVDPDDPHLARYDCGHGQVVNLAKHQHLGGRPVYTVRDSHARGCARHDADARPGRVMVGNGIGRERNGRVSNGSARAARDVSQDDETTDFDRAMAAAGVESAISGRQ